MRSLLGESLFWDNVVFSSVRRPLLTASPLLRMSFPALKVPPRFYNTNQFLWSLLSCVYMTLGELGDVNHSPVQSRWENWRTRCSSGLSAWPFRSWSEALSLLNSSQWSHTNPLRINKMDGWMRMPSHSEVNRYSELIVEVKGGILGQHISLKCAVQTGDSLHHERVGISVTLYRSRPLGISYGEDQGHIFILYPKNETDKKLNLLLPPVKKRKGKEISISWAFISSIPVPGISHTTVIITIVLSLCPYHQDGIVICTL